MIRAYNSCLAKQRQSCELDITGFIAAYEQSLCMVYDLELSASDMIFVCNTSSCHDNYLCYIIYCATIFINPNIGDQVIGRYMQVSLKSMHRV